MPTLSIKHIVSFSSEDTKHCTENVLSLNPNKTWRCENPGEKCAYVLLQLEKASVITCIDIGNDHSAFVEILVSRTGNNSNQFVELLPMSSLMSPVESRNSTTFNRVRMFSSENFTSEARNKKWDQIKVVCTQPFNSHVTYGLAFIKINGTPESNVEISETNTSEKKDRLIGRFRFREDSPDDNTLGIGALFARRTELNQENKFVKKTAAAIREASVVTTYTSKHKICAKNSNFSYKEENATDDKPDLHKRNRNRDELLYNSEDMQSNERLDKLLERDKITKDSKTQSKECSPHTPKNVRKNVQIAPTASNSSKKKNEDTSKAKIKDVPHYQKECTPSASKRLKTEDCADVIGRNSLIKKNKSSTDYKSPVSKNKPSPSKKETNEYPKTVSTKEVKQEIYRDFNKLFENVIFVLSGFENPLRANLRQKATEMGAKYQPNWSDKCTHLICAFANTPKYQQVCGKGKIVTKTWIEDCHSQQKYIPWRRYSLVSSDLQKNESDEEIFSISSAPAHSSSSFTKTDNSINSVIKVDNNKELDPFEMSTEIEEETDKKGDFFHGKTFHLNESVGAVSLMKLKTLIEFLGGTVEESLTSDIDYNITLNKDYSISEVPNIKPEWIYECNDMEMILPINRYIL